MGNEVLARGNVPRLLGMVDGKCGRLRQPGTRNLEEGWAGATQETRDDGGGTRQGMVQDDEGGNNVTRRRLVV